MEIAKISLRNNNSSIFFEDNLDISQYINKVV
jgi:hypothetical protein